MRLFDSQELPGHYVSASHQKPAPIAIFKWKNVSGFLFVYSSIVDPDPKLDRVGSESFSRIWIRIRIDNQGMPIWIRANEKVDKFNLLSENFNILSKILKILTHLALRWTAVRLELWIYPWVFEKIQNALMGCSGAWRKMIHEKIRKLKISGHCPFKSGVPYLPLPGSDRRLMLSANWCKMGWCFLILGALLTRSGGWIFRTLSSSNLKLTFKWKMS